ncbi:MBL fold metallo-hydrolase [Heliophilum fasciatum]|uniref:Glyoxylase-like metal-dependent hydrolase (Beta-lactamase superfamily II) n=1 Tax=Heliophilum fasciatum TaxID=35700 RepID=A0A4R2RME4_9FIRM|nr:MBL fold metallo-hydrolase [Heliophilum fasciatum]MCW2278057.1 glyoxylase-like metal-dependent hydrolase (beta-lactamase superfamily II) [Heliophilum fasciatum]TCP64323.1 glyoxylase-like metal-dependent hydrolase (beta-lactamase superfamily II) [Heliophilum fasciatum]
MIIRNLEVGALQTNSYLAMCPETKEAILIDPGDEGQRIVAWIEEQKAKVVAIVNTHGHADHIGANKAVQAATGAPLLCHSDDAPMLTTPAKNLSVYMGPPLESPAAARELADGDTITAGTLQFTVLHTPGHTRGGICLYAPAVLFAGDTLFEESVGRTDLPGGSYPTLINSIRQKLLTLPAETVVYPGHGPSTTIGHEAVANPFLASR